MSATTARPRRRPRRVEPEEHENHERWAVSYADMMTVLLGLFIVLYAVSQVDAAKFEQLRQSLAVGFGGSHASILDGAPGTLDGAAAALETPALDAGPGEVAPPPETVVAGTGGRADDDTGVDPELLEAAKKEYSHLQNIADRIGKALERKDLGDRVRFRVTDRGLVIGLVADDVFFSPASAKLTGTARSVIDTTAPVVAKIGEEISVEGHANILPVSGRYATNWELSADRATQVLRRLVEHGKVAPGRIAAVGFGEARPLAETGGMDELEANRRVDLVILSASPENVRTLLPIVAPDTSR